ncbi:elongation of very long chain fatty acids protein 3-like [Centruroides sculpturatus]|uniref:elongation of very long chain fatty acids protein 3-like n=1 Tax=Centruroides sculpturatus TaxID=218467 RepID=UPI000C6D0B5F|nr:elongation of very long chain fatty acids protein 3-like [Centruroides sculpturatus]
MRIFHSYCLVVVKQFALRNTMEKVESTVRRGEFKLFYVEEYLHQYVDNDWTQSFLPYTVPTSLAYMMDNKIEVSKYKGQFEPLYVEQYLSKYINFELIECFSPYVIHISAIYIIVIFTLQHYMKSKQPYQLRGPLFFWNTLLALFSICGTIRVLPGLWIIIRDFGFTFSVCNVSFALKHHPIEFWVCIFACSKIIEFGDTLFIVFRKQKLIFLHWYHHSLTLVITTYNVSGKLSTGYWYVAMNLLVHSFMYLYFAAKAIKVKVPRSIAIIITISQILQMIIACFVTIWAANQYFTGKYCEQNYQLIIFSMLVYTTHAVLFLCLFTNTYFNKRHKSTLQQRKDN